MSKLTCVLCLPIFFMLLVPARAQPGVESLPPQSFRGLYPVEELDRFPADQEVRRVGFIADDRTWTHVWEGFQPGTDVPPVDFSREIILYTRGTDPLNHISVFTERTAEEAVVDVRTFTTLIGYLGPQPIDEVRWIATTIGRAGIRSLRIGGQLFSVPAVPEPSTAVLDLLACLAAATAFRRHSWARRQQDDLLR